MRVILEVKSGPLAGRRIQLREGQVAEVGRTQWADFSVPGDEQMADVHFAVQNSRRGCIVRDLGNGNGTFVNGEAISEKTLRSGDEITAGSTTFTVRTVADGAPSVESPVCFSANVAAAGKADVPIEDIAAPSPAELCCYLELNEDAQKLADESQTVEQWLAALSAAGQLYSALRVQAHLLPPREAVCWACLCLEDVYGDALSGADGDALQAARQWVAEPSEENRRGAEAAAEATAYQGAAAWVAAGAFWSGGSIAPPDMDPVPPDARLAGQAVTSALLIAAAAGDPVAAAERQRTFLRKTAEVAVGSNPRDHD